MKTSPYFSLYIFFQVQTHSKPRLLRILADFTTGSGALEGAEYNVTCCAGVAIDLLRSLADDLRFEVDLYLVNDGLFGSKRGNKWNGKYAFVQKQFIILLNALVRQHFMATH